jgi:hypothetical protein
LVLNFFFWSVSDIASVCSADSIDFLPRSAAATEASPDQIGT